MIEEDHEGHGNSVAAWASVIIMLFGFAVAALGVMNASVPTAIGGGVVILIGAAVWPILARMGMGDKHKPQSLYN
ncbi:MAG: HGxxPAAW family protein [Tetrasphaera sp.]